MLNLQGLEANRAGLTEYALECFERAHAVRPTDTSTHTGSASCDPTCTIRSVGLYGISHAVRTRPPYCQQLLALLDSTSHESVYTNMRVHAPYTTNIRICTHAPYQADPVGSRSPTCVYA